jgi:hypothetical protein
MSTITSNDGSLTDLGSNQWQISTFGVESINLAVNYTQNNSTNLTIRALRVPHTDETKKIYIDTVDGSGNVTRWIAIFTTDTSGDGETVVVGCSKSDTAIIFEISITGTDDAVVDLAVTIDSKA